MHPRATRALGLGAIGAAAAALALLVAYDVSPGLVLEMDRDTPQITSGFYPVEREGDRTFAWTAPRAFIRLQGLDRRAAWQCVVKLRGARPPTDPQPLVDVSIDDAIVLRERVSNDFQDLAVTVPDRPSAPGMTFALSSAPVFMPGPSDRRQLGVQVDRFSCQLMDAAWTLPPRRSIVTAMISGAFVGAAFGLAAGFPLWALGAVVLIAIAQAIPLAAGAAPYTTSYQIGVARLALWTMVPLAPRWPFGSGAPSIKRAVLDHPGERRIGPRLPSPGGTTSACPAKQICGDPEPMRAKDCRSAACRPR